MFWVYIIQSELDGSYYVGSTKDIRQRLFKHNTAQSLANKKKRPWVLVYQKCYSTRSEALKREYKIKSYKGGVLFKQLLGK